MSTTDYSKMGLALMPSTLMVEYLAVMLVEKCFPSLQPRVVSVDVLDDFATANSKHHLDLDPKEIRIALFRMTHSIDCSGKYRMQERAVTRLFKGLMRIPGLVAVVANTVTEPDRWVAAFWRMEADSFSSWWAVCFCLGLCPGYTAFETMLDQTHIKWSLLVHHQVVVFASLSVLLGFFSPGIIWFGFTASFLIFPIDFALVYRALYAHSNPALTARLLRYAQAWLAMCTVLNLIGQVLIIVRTMTFQPEKWWLAMVSLAVMLGFLWDDYVTLRTYGQLAVLPYQATEMNIPTPGADHVSNFIEGHRKDATGADEA